VTIFLIKSVLSAAALGLAGYGMYTMLEVFGREAAAERAGLFKRRHRVSGWVYVLLVLVVSYLCISFLAATKVEPSPRTAIHILLSFLIIALLAVKVLVVRLYRQYYALAKTIGIALGVLTFSLVGVSAGVFLSMSRFGLDRTADRSAAYALRGPLLAVRQVEAPNAAAVRTDRRSIGRGRALFAARCATCHDPASERTIVGPGLKSLLRNPRLPASGHPATPESIRFQLRQPMKGMPSFAYLSEDEMHDLIAYLNTL
jgi:mono/diheme cytochrome c family protein